MVWLYSASELRLLTLATLRIYKTALIEAAKGLQLNWWVPFFHLLYLVIFVIAAFLAGNLGFLGGFLLGLLLAMLLASYLSTVVAGVRHEHFLVKEAWRDMAALFSPVISVLFSFFILGMIARFAFSRPDQMWLLGGLNAILVIMFSPAPEVIYSRRGYALDTFGECLEFVKDNILEWYIPWLMLGLAIAAYNHQLFRAVVWQVLGTPPLEFLTLLMSMSGALFYAPLKGGLVALIVLYVTYFVFLFRGSLYQQLSQSSRRRRIYQARMS